MVFDGMVTRAITHELDQQLATGRVLKIYHPTETEIVMSIRSYGKNKKLLLSAHSSYARVHLTNDHYENPKEPTMYCMILRKYLSGSFLEKVEQTENERIVQLQFRTTNEIGDVKYMTLCMEIMGKHSNILLIDQEKQVILDSIKHISASQNRHRTLLPGSPYKMPPTQGKLNPFTIDGDKFIQKLDFNAGKLDRQIVDQFMGMSPLLAKEMINRTHLGTLSDYKETFVNIRDQLLNHEYQPQIMYGKKKETFYVLPLTTQQGEIKEFSSVSSLLDHYYSGKAERDRVKQKAGDLTRMLKNEINKNHRKLKKLDQTLDQAKDAANYQRDGELLTAHMHLVTPGDKEVEVVDYYHPDQIKRTISLNENKSPSENAQSLFKKYHKLKNSKLMVEEEKKKAYEEIEYLQEVIEQIEHAREQDIEEIREELQEQGYVKKKAKSNNKKKQQANKPTPEKFVSSDGIEILVGKNNKQNEYLTSRIANKDDIWLHTKNIPGSHVVIRSNDPHEETLYEAAQLAANFSKSSQSSSVPVDYTRIRHVRKPNGAKPGFVTYDHQKTLYVTPENRFLRELKDNESE
ncbi:fibronectin/fibrinogen-binding protein [Gracilibacillus halophilus YIM-C55.5]|uniref:Rqc2 homolog RqcH n=1 Tax=Gracilibacillus halophilus YIM-C55.5 TaxID=1308866 RepID=N4WG97_9BACI|nr:NFACT RNA binding domain-containing protein [Gracilibacillus halophilus]ENH98294.1 fibronectin/fibrinogen-binding protein [Gracilibacillus halophilus YIM-C55.5]